MVLGLLVLAGAAGTEKPIRPVRAPSRVRGHCGTVPTSVHSGEAFPVSSWHRMLWNSSKLSVCLPGNVNVSSRPPLLHLGTQHSPRAPAKFRC